MGEPLIRWRRKRSTQLCRKSCRGRMWHHFLPFCQVQVKGCLFPRIWEMEPSERAEQSTLLKTGWEQWPTWACFLPQSNFTYKDIHSIRTFEQLAHVRQNVSTPLPLIYLASRLWHVNTSKHCSHYISYSERTLTKLILMLLQKHLAKYPFVSICYIGVVSRVFHMVNKHFLFSF